MSMSATQIPTTEPSKDVTGQNGKVDPFLTKKEQLNEHLNKTKKLLEGVQKLEQSSGTNPKDLIAAQSRLRQEITSLSSEWSAVNAIYLQNMKKQNSKYSKEEMANRGSFLQLLQSEIEAIKEANRAGYTNQSHARSFWGKSSSSSSSGTFNRYVKMSESELFKPKPAGYVPTSNNEMTDEQEGQLQGIRERDTQLDEEITVIGKGVEDLRELALAQNKEIMAQNQMIDPLREKIETVHEDMVTTNLRLADALKNIRDGSKWCVDFGCVVLLIVLCIILYYLTKA